MQEGTSLKRQLHVGVVDSTELVHAFSSVYNMASSHGEEVGYNRSGEPVAVVAVYSDGDLIDVVSGPGLNDEDLAKIGDEVEDLLRPGTTKVARQILFAALRVSECLDLRPYLQIVPPPANAPEPPLAHGKHPFVLEFPYADSKNVLTVLRRRAIELKRWKLLLNLFVEWGVSAVGNDQDWTQIFEQRGSEYSFRTEYLMRGYIVQGFETDAADFTDSSVIPPMIEIPNNDYLNQLGIGEAQTLRTAPFVRNLLRGFPSLPLHLQERFLRAAFWYQQAAVPHVSYSASLIALVSSIETLIKQEKAVPNCEKCGKGLGKSATQRFIDFVKAQLPGSDDVGSERAITKLYRVRSALSHGWSLLRLDEDSSFGLHPATDQERWERISATHVTRAVLLNWLASECARH